MARYRKIELQMWGDSRFRDLSAAAPNAQTLWMYLLCGPRTTVFPGLVVASPAVIAADLGWPLDPHLDLDGSTAFETASRRRPRCLRDGLTEILDHGMANADFGAGVIVLTKALFSSPGIPRDSSKPGSPNQLIGWEKSWDGVPECHLKDLYLLELRAFATACSTALGRAFGTAFKTHLERVPPSVRDGWVTSSRSGTGTGTGSSQNRTRAIPDPDPRAAPELPDPDHRRSRDLDPAGQRRAGQSVTTAGAGTAQERASSPRFDVLHADAVSGDPVTIARRAQARRAWERLNALRRELAAEFGEAEPVELHFMSGGHSDLMARLAMYGSHSDAARALDRVFEVAAAEARAKRTMKWIKSTMFSETSWEAKLAMSIDDARETRAKRPEERNVFAEVDAIGAQMRARRAAVHGDEPCEDPTCDIFEACRGAVERAARIARERGES